MFTVTPEMFNDPNGFYIVCKSQEELDACLTKLHNIGILWRSGETLVTPNQVKFDNERSQLAEAKRMADEMSGFAGFLAKELIKKLDDEDDEMDGPTYAILLGNPPPVHNEERSQLDSVFHRLSARSGYARFESVVRTRKESSFLELHVPCGGQVGSYGGNVR